MNGLAKGACDLQRATLLLVLCGALVATGGCKVVTIEHDRAIRAQTDAAFEAEPYVNGIWSRRLLPEFVGRAMPLATLLPSVDDDLDQAGKKFGRRTAEGSAWTFIVSGVATVAAVERTSRRGTVTLKVEGMRSTRPVIMQTGPIVVGTTIRDAASFLAFDDFGDQLAFADVGRALNERSLAVIQHNKGLFRVGGKLRFIATTAPAQDDRPVLLTPVALEDAGA